MANVKEYYKNDHVVGPELVDLHDKLAETILSIKNHYNVFEFGCGIGKNLKHLANKSTQFFELRGLDISPKTIASAIEFCKGYRNIIFEIGDEEFLKKYKDGYFHVTFTCSVLDHIENITDVITQLKRITTDGIVLAETNDKINEMYFPHDYEKFGFQKLDYRYYSNGDHAFYEIWVWKKE